MKTVLPLLLGALCTRAYAAPGGFLQPTPGVNEWVETDADACQLVTIDPADPTLCYADPDRCRQAPV